MNIKLIPPSAPEYVQANQLRSLDDRRKEAAQKKEELRDERKKLLLAQTLEESRSQWIGNTTGDLHDAFQCANSAEGASIVSFDYGHFWWADDGRCAKLHSSDKDSLQAQIELNQRRAQQARDSDAELSSYWSTKLRVDTDIDSSWLPDEERTCSSYPNQRGVISVLNCDSNKAQNHIIPVTFWGGTKRATVSGWRCRREKSLLTDNFVCKAIN